MFVKNGGWGLLLADANIEINAIKRLYLLVLVVHLLSHNDYYLLYSLRLIRVNDDSIIEKRFSLSAS